MDKRTVIAIALSLLVLLGFQSLVARRRGQMQPQPTGPSVETIEQPSARGPAGPATMPRQLPSKKELKENVTEIQTEAHNLVFSDIGGSLKAAYLNGYEERCRGEILFEEENPAERLFAMQSAALPGLEERKFERTKKNGILEYQMTDPGRIEITKRYTFHKSLDYIDLDIGVKNLSSRKMGFSYQIRGPSNLEKTSLVAGRTFLQTDVMIDGKRWRAKSVKGIQARSGDISWVALKNRYFTLILKPFGVMRSVEIAQTADGNFLTALNSQSYELEPGEEAEDRYLLYAGPLDEKRIAAIGYDMQEVVDYGFFGGLSKALLSVLRFFQKGTKNWGVAIILLTMLINAVLFPLTVKSFSSMQQMKKIQPHIQKLKELHKDNPQKLNKEMMELYKRYNVNPLGGCLPLLLQMPIFIALYQGLMRSVDLKGAQFLWIKDLAKPDAVPLPFSLPLIGASINILPLLMVGVMLLQQKVSQGISAGAMTGEQAGQQRMMMVAMPLLFGVLFYKMPAGLVLYWLTNTILMTMEQGFISRRMSGS
jgi:YidC/Oxa1 family membrane protein insertase